MPGGDTPGSCCPTAMCSSPEGSLRSPSCTIRRPARGRTPAPGCPPAYPTMECRIGSTTTLLGTGNVLLAGGEAGLISNPQTTPRSEVTWVAARSVQNLNTLIPAGSGYQIQGST